MKQREYIKSLAGNSISNINNFTGEVIISKLDRFNATSNAAHFSIKVVLSGNETYKLNGNAHSLTQNSFLVVNPNSEIELSIEDEDTRGICLFPCTELFTDIYRNKTSTEIQLLDNPFDQWNLPHFTVKKHNFNENCTGKFLSDQIRHIYNGLNENVDFDSPQFYLKLSELLIQDQVKIEQLLCALSSTKKSTKEELYRRVDIAKQYMDDNFTERIHLDELAQNAYLSKFHFTRSFKSIYKISPIQYLLQLRLNKATELLQKDYSYTDVTHMVGFSDVKNLRKAIQKHKAA